MASLRARSLFLPENSALKFGESGVARRSKHDISKPVSIKRNFISSVMSLGKIPPSVLSTAQRWIQYLIIYSSYTAHFTQLNKFSENNVFGCKTVCDTALSPTCYTFNTLFISVIEPFDSLEV
jgi:hypothetical protein